MCWLNSQKANYNFTVNQSNKNQNKETNHKKSKYEFIDKKLKKIVEDKYLCSKLLNLNWRCAKKANSKCKVYLQGPIFVCQTQIYIYKSVY